MSNYTHNFFYLNIFYYFLASIKKLIFFWQILKYIELDSNFPLSKRLSLSIVNWKEKKLDWQKKFLNIWSVKVFNENSSLIYTIPLNLMITWWINLNNSITWWLLLFFHARVSCAGSSSPPDIVQAHNSISDCNFQLWRIEACLTMKLFSLLLLYYWLKSIVQIS